MSILKSLQKRKKDLQIGKDNNEQINLKNHRTNWQIIKYKPWSYHVSVCNVEKIESKDKTQSQLL